MIMMIVRVRKTRTIGTDIDAYSAWTPTDLMGDYTFITKFEGSGWWGQLGCERILPPELERLPAMSDQRVFAVKAWQEANDLRAYAFIIAAHPEAMKGIRRGPTIEVLMQ